MDASSGEHNLSTFVQSDPEIDCIEAGTPAGQCSSCAIPGCLSSHRNRPNPQHLYRCDQCRGPECRGVTPRRQSSHPAAADALAGPAVGCVVGDLFIHHPMGASCLKFTQLTHLEIRDWPDGHRWEAWSGLALIPLLTHLAFYDAMIPVFRGVLQPCKSIQVLVMACAGQKHFEHIAGDPGQVRRRDHDGFAIWNVHGGEVLSR